MYTRARGSRTAAEDRTTSNLVHYMLPPHEHDMAAPADESAAPMLLLPISSTPVVARYKHSCFVEGSERAPHFFSADVVPDELAGVVHRDDFALLIGAVNRIRADADKVESSRCRAFSRWLRAGGPASGSLTPNDAPDMQCVSAGRQALVDFLVDETDVRWRKHGISWSYEPLPAAMELHADLLIARQPLAGAVASSGQSNDSVGRAGSAASVEAVAPDPLDTLPIGSFVVCCRWGPM